MTAASDTNDSFVFNDGRQPDWAKGDGLLPAVVQHAITGQVLMLAYMNTAALQHTIATQQVTFYSRSRQQLWTKGETSGNLLQLRHIELDCDGDTLLVQAVPAGPTCHLGDVSCFGSAGHGGGVLSALSRVIAERASAGDDGSYTASLLQAGIERCAQKVGEEGVEVALAATNRDDDGLLNESADLLYHLLVCLRARDLDLDQVLAALDGRRR